ncbi:Flp pilus assembly protein CpaB [Celerinatantimonas yamalensis]|uniref:Flp pilus assembly protein CpaB n=1 Tax=Celerinatantimonas yamalensis TaxID=559956 RepID=A0ABW9G2F1_9GAMM
MNSKLIFVIAFLAIFLGLAAMTGVFSPKPAPPPSVVKAPVEVKVNFWIARRDLLKGQPVTQADLIEKRLPISQAKAFSVEQNQSVEFVPGMVARFSIQANQAVRGSDFATPKSRDYLTLVTPPDKIAYPVPISASDLATMRINASDYVNVMLLSSPGGDVHTQQSSFNNIGNLSVSSLFKSVKVVSVEPASGDSKQSHVLLAMSQEQIAKLIIAQRIGLIYIFRGSIDTDQPLHDVLIRDVLPSYSSVKELRGSASSASISRAQVN